MLYLSSLFKEKFPKIFQDITSHTAIHEIPNTKDIWIRDLCLLKIRLMIECSFAISLSTLEIQTITH